MKKDKVKKTILIVEDERAYLKLLEFQLVENGYNVIEATNGIVGLKKAKIEKPDIILLDIRMPVMDGMVMLGLLRKQEENKNTKVIMLTNFEPDQKILERVINDKASYYFVKSDIKFKDLLEKIKELLK